MIELLHMLSAIPELVIGLAKYPRVAAVMIVSGMIVACVIMFQAGDQESQAQQKAVSAAADNDKPRDRRIVRALKWLWARD